MKIEELLELLDIDYSGVYGKNGSYIIDLDTSDDYGRVYSKLDRSEDLDYEADSSQLNDTDISNQVYMYEDKFLLTLIADFAGDTYRLVIKAL